MPKLLFKNPVFDRGTNLTVRRGVKWDVVDHHGVEIAATQTSDEVVAVVDIQTRVIRFYDIQTDDLLHEHDPACTSYDGLLRAMKNVYEEFDEMEIVTLVWFDFYPEDPEADHA